MKASNKEQVILISGGTQGLGLAIAEQLIEQGCRKLAVTGRRTAQGKAAAALLQAKGCEARFIRCDVGQVEDCQNTVADVINHFGTIDGLVNAAADTSRGSLFDTTAGEWDMHMAVNLRGPFLLMQAVVKHLVEQEKPGAILNILSTSAFVGQSFLLAYSTSKGGLHVLTKNAANALLPHKIRVNAIAPGWMDTPNEDAVQRAFHSATDGWLADAEARMPFGQLAKPHQIAPLVAYLLSPDSGIITGAVIHYDQQIIGAVHE